MRRHFNEYAVDLIILTDFPPLQSEKAISSEVFSKLKELGLVIQLFDCKNVLSLEHVEAAVLNALAAMKAGRNIARDLAVELLVRLSTNRKIDEAIRTVGVSDDTRQLGVNLVSTKEEVLDRARPLIIGSIKGTEIPGIPLRSEEELNRLARLYGVSDTQLRTIKSRSKQEALEFAILEKMALMDL